jgi:ribonuclease HII
LVTRRSRLSTQPGLFDLPVPPLDHLTHAEGVESTLFDAGFAWLIGVDEAGRGPLAGPVTVGAVLVRRAEWRELEAVAAEDSKAMTAVSREAGFERLQESTLVKSVVHRSPARIDELNILGATMSAMLEAVMTCWTEGRPTGPGLVLVDGNRAIPELTLQQVLLVKGDARSRVIGAGSILAKVARDRVMDALHAEHPGYGFDRHRGYPTPEHFRALQTLGPTVHHRRSFAPVKNVLVDVDSSASSTRKRRHPSV